MASFLQFVVSGGPFLVKIYTVAHVLQKFQKIVQNE